jgi:hypothetical protein
VHVVRVGTLDQRNPLAPRTNAPALIVLEVRIRGKAASAYGTTFHELRRSGPPDDLERDYGNAIQWERTLSTVPQELLILAEEQGEVVAKLRFLKCSAPPNPRGRETKPKPRASPRALENPIERLPRGTLEK